MKNCTKIALILVSTSFSLPAFADGQKDSFAVGAHVGTHGPGLDLNYKVSSKITLKGSASLARYSVDGSDLELDDDVDINVSGNLDFKLLDITAEYHPFENGWFVGGGLSVGSRKISASGTPSDSVEFDDVTYTPDEIGTLNADLSFGSSAPFVGLGYNNAFSSGSPWNINVMVGAEYVGSPKLSLTTDGTLANDDDFLNSLESERSSIENDLSGVKFLPLVILGLSYRF